MKQISFSTDRLNDSLLSSCVQARETSQLPQNLFEQYPIKTTNGSPSPGRWTLNRIPRNFRRRQMDELRSHIWTQLVRDNDRG